MSRNPISAGGRLLCVAVLLGLAQPVARGETNAAPASSAPLVALSSPVGEELIYRVYWGIIPVGKTRIVTRWIEEDGRQLLAIRYRTRSNRFVATLYPVDDVIEAIVDPVTFLPVRFKIMLREGRHRRDEVTRFDHARGVAYWESFVKKQTKEYPIESDTRDVVTFMYYMRSQTFAKGEDLKFRVMADDKIYDLFVHVAGSERVKLSTFGSVKSLKLEPTAAFDGLFVRAGEVTVWVSEDERKLVTKMVGSVPVASIRAVISEVRGPGDDSWIVRTREDLKRGGEAEDPAVEQAMKELD